MRIGFVGAGRHARNALYPALDLAGLDLAVTCASHLANAEDVGRRFGAPEAYDDVSMMLDRCEDLDGVVVCVPAEAYAEVLPACLRRGVPVYCEKPAGLSAAEVLDVDEQAGDVPVVVGYMKRFAPAYVTALEATADPAFGSVTSVHVRFVMGPWVRSFDNYVIDNVVHAVDLVRAFAGEVIEVVARRHSPSATEHALSLLLRFASGAVGTAQLGTNASWFADNELLEVVGVGASLSVSNVDTFELRPSAGASLRRRPNYTVPLPINGSATTMGFAGGLQHFREVVEHGAPNRSPLSSAAATLAVAEDVIAQVGA